MKPPGSGTACGASCPGWNDFAGDSGDYAIPVTNGSGAVGKALAFVHQPSRWHWFLARVPSSRRYRFIAGGKWSWQYSVAAGGSVLQAKNYTITQRDDAGQTRPPIGYNGTVWTKTSSIVVVSNLC